MTRIDGDSEDKPLLRSLIERILDKIEAQDLILAELKADVANMKGKAWGIGIAAGAIPGIISIAIAWFKT